jgi:hypothetical protein
MRVTSRMRCPDVVVAKSVEPQRWMLDFCHLTGILDDVKMIDRVVSWRQIDLQS